VASSALAGSWRNSDGVTMTCEDTGLVVLDRPGPKQRPVVGEYTFDGNAATFRNRVESKLCADELGQYTVDVSTDACTITPVRDACADRVKLLNRTLQTLREVGDGRAELVGLLDLRIEHATLLQRLAKATQRVREGLELRHAIFREVTKHAHEWPQPRRDDRPALMQPKRLILQPARSDEAVEKLPRPLPRIPQCRSLILCQQ
jgi:hypothetical protein